MRGNMAKRTARTPTKSSRKASKTSDKAIKNKGGHRESFDQRVSADAPTGALMRREARGKERFRELFAWYMLQGVDEATARRRAQDEIDNDPRKD